jgi:hypothetical protein
MRTSAALSGVLRNWSGPADNATALSRLEQRLPTLLSVIAGMVDLTGFFTLGNIFTAHITGNLVLAAAAAVRGGPFNLAQALAIPVFMLAVVVVWLIAKASDYRGPVPARLLLVVQFLLLTAVLIFSVFTKPSATVASRKPHVARCHSKIDLFYRCWAPPRVYTANTTG